MDVVKALEEVLGYIPELPHGKEGDGISQEHLFQMMEKVNAEHIPSFIGAQNVVQIKKKNLKEYLNLIGNFDEKTAAFDALEEYQEAVEKALKKEAKLHRWLGWMQAVLAAFRIVSLEEMKQLNKNS